ncbi:hypothetical protein [Kitasatospora cinereorecta]|uniref:Uncharacterized protein n=1 Tax=Kitasatospora cinereorecta TaxID=285560 RepID=A0ABW0VSI9_9ACTN
MPKLTGKAKSLDSPYVGGESTAWVKLRHVRSVEATVAGVTGTPRRPEAVLVVLADGRRAVTSPRLDAGLARQVAAAVAGRLHPAPDGPAGTYLVAADPPLLAEVVVGTGRHATVRFVRIRPQV